MKKYAIICKAGKYYPVVKAWYGWRYFYGFNLNRVYRSTYTQAQKFLDEKYYGSTTNKTQVLKYTPPRDRERR